MVRAAAAVAAVLLTLAPARAQDAIYTGSLHCGPIPAMDLPEVNARVTITQQGDRLTFVRELRSRTTATGARETAVGTLAGGKATLTGGASVTGASGASTQLQSRFEAALANGTITLTGTQKWTRRNLSAERDCTGTLRR